MGWLVQMPVWAQIILWYGFAHATTAAYRFIKLLATKGR